MGTRTIIKFYNRRDDEPVARIYKHWDGYPEGTLPLIRSFFDEVKRQADDTRFCDPSYLSAKFVVFLSRYYAQHTNYRAEGAPAYLNAPLDFLSVGILSKDDVGEEYVYHIVCDCQGDYPTVSYTDLHHERGPVTVGVDISNIIPDTEADAIWEKVRSLIPAETPL